VHDWIHFVLLFWGFSERVQSCWLAKPPPTC
jgi:hypothetical protein